ncbi:MAG TPA: nucleoside 2-deoxyribosyltransferase domain-containing protein [Planctomycetota bacterium]|nr:nucleoside 2-deoxyribosyltransferase domain-containing protein [Planctomycetota bacterium]
MRTILSPEPYSEFERPAIYLAGGVSGRNWQAEVTAALSSVPGTVFNPRAPNSETRVWAREQIEWEFASIRRADLITFWFSDGEINPITLFELGAQLQRLALLRGGGGNRLLPRIVIGMAPGYLKGDDVKIQTELLLPETPFVSTLDALIEETRAFIETMAPLAAG